MVNHVNRGISRGQGPCAALAYIRGKLYAQLFSARGSGPAKDRLFVPIQYFAIFPIENGDEKMHVQGL